MHFEICNISLKEEIKCITSKVIEKKLYQPKRGEKRRIFKEEEHRES